MRIWLETTSPPPSSGRFRLTTRQCRELAALLGQVIATVEIDPPTTTGR